MTPGATPTHTFNLPVSTDDVAALRVTYEQGGKNLLQKEMDECTLSGTQVIIKLKQEETLLFESNGIVRIQLKGKTKGGDVLISDIIKRPTNIVLDREVI